MKAWAEKFYNKDCKRTQITSLYEKKMGASLVSLMLQLTRRLTCITYVVIVLLFEITVNYSLLVKIIF